MPVPVYFILIGGLAIVDRVLKIWILSLPDSGGFLLETFLVLNCLKILERFSVCRRFPPF